MNPVGANLDSAETSSAAPLPWQRSIAEALRSARVDVVAYVPDARLTGILDALADSELPAVRGLTREEECVGYAAGFGAAGGRAAVLMQCSGLGNCLNALASFALPYGIGLPLVISMRGTLGERNPAQTAMGRATPALLRALGVQAFPVRTDQEAIPTAAGAFDLAYATGTTTALLLDPVLGGGREGG